MFVRVVWCLHFSHGRGFVILFSVVFSGAVFTFRGKEIRIGIDTQVIFGEDGKMEKNGVQNKKKTHFFFNENNKFE